MNLLYADFDEHNICFDLVGWDEIEDDAFYNNASFGQLAAYIDPSRIDLFLFANDKLNGGVASGIPGGALKIGGFAFGSNLVTSHVISHEMGHCLGLYHTFQGMACASSVSCPELVDGSNCTTCGDFVCDTPADPQTFQVNQSTCIWNGTANCSGSTTDANGDTYVPRTDLIMAYIAPVCMQVHTAGQGARMKDMIANSSLLQATLTTNETVIYMKDNPNDFGLEPNPIGWGNVNRFWISRDIVIRNMDDNIFVHENPEHTTIDPIWVYVKVRNKGCVPTLGTEELKTYWTKSSIALWDWPNSWVNYTVSSVLYGDIIGTQTIPVINPGESVIVKFPWFAPDPADFGETESHVCLVARIETAPASPFGMTFAETNNILPNTKNNRKIIWKNVTVVNDNIWDFVGVVVGNVTQVTRKYDLIFRVPDDELGRPFIEENMVTVDLGGLYQRWISSGGKGTNIRRAKTNNMAKIAEGKHHSKNHFPHAALAPNTIEIVGREAKLQGLSFAPGELETVYFRFNYNSQSTDPKTDFQFEVLQAEENGDVLAGVMFEIARPNCQLTSAGPDINMAHKGTAFLSVQQVNFGAEYEWRDGQGLLVGTGPTVSVAPNTTTTYVLQASFENGCIASAEVTVNVDHQLKERFKMIHPNPARDNITAHCDLKNAQTARMEIKHAVTGVMEKQMQLDVTKTKFSIWVGDLQPGAHNCFLYIDNVLEGTKQLIIMQ